MDEFFFTLGLSRRVCFNVYSKCSHDLFICDDLAKRSLRPFNALKMHANSFAASGEKIP